MEKFVLTLSDEVASRVPNIANLTQKNIEEVLLDWIDQTSQKPFLSEFSGLDESQLIQKINLGFSSDWWHRYRELIAQRQAETINESDRTDLIQMSEALENANVERIKALGELAQSRGCSLEEIMKAFDIEPAMMTDG
jgi:hypothetical protein